MAKFSFPLRCGSYLPGTFIGGQPNAALRAALARTQLEQSGEGARRGKLGASNVLLEACAFARTGTCPREEDGLFETAIPVSSNETLTWQDVQVRHRLLARAASWVDWTSGHDETLLAVTIGHEKRE